MAYGWLASSELGLSMIFQSRVSSGRKRGSPPAYERLNREISGVWWLHVLMCAGSTIVAALLVVQVCFASSIAELRKLGALAGLLSVCQLGILTVLQVVKRRHQHSFLARLRDCGFHMCPDCGYRLTGLAAGSACPECGLGDAIGVAEVEWRAWLESRNSR